jgi:hypothetical protein
MTSSAAAIQIKVTVDDVLAEAPRAQSLTFSSFADAEDLAIPAVYRYLRHRLVLSEGEQGSEHDEHDDTGRSNARPSGKPHRPSL